MGLGLGLKRMGFRSTPGALLLVQVQQLRLYGTTVPGMVQA
jgi:hypothetical protein